MSESGRVKGDDEKDRSRHRKLVVPRKLSNSDQTANLP